MLDRIHVPRHMLRRLSRLVHLDKIHAQLRSHFCKEKAASHYPTLGGGMDMELIAVFWLQHVEFILSATLRFHL